MAKIDLINSLEKISSEIPHRIINIFLGNNVKMHNIHNYDNSKFKSDSLMFNYYVFKKKKF